MKKGVYKCKKCKGTGQIQESSSYMIHGINHTVDRYNDCEHCKGDGYLDWIESIVGKEMTDHEKNKEEIKKMLNTGNWKLTMGKLR